VARKMLVVHPEKCTACRLCELACTFHQEGEFHPLKARLTVGIFPEENVYVPIVCEQCEVAACQEACPSGAIWRNAVTGALEVDVSRCVGCRMCVMACPFGTMVHVESGGKMQKCDLCQGDPQCVAVCPWGALEYAEPNEAALARRREVARRLAEVLRGVKV